MLLTTLLYRFINMLTINKIRASHALKKKEHRPMFKFKIHVMMLDDLADRATAARHAHLNYTMEFKNLEDATELYKTLLHVIPEAKSIHMTLIESRRHHNDC